MNSDDRTAIVFFVIGILLEIHSLRPSLSDRKEFAYMIAALIFVLVGFLSFRKGIAKDV